LGIKDINLAKIDVEEKKLASHSFSSALKHWRLLFFGFEVL
jgi:hypothetical protein